MKKIQEKIVHHKPEYGPSFGEHESDISIYHNFLDKNSYSNFPEQYMDSTGKGRSVFTGNPDSNEHGIKVKEIEVFKII